MTGRDAAAEDEDNPCLRSSYTNRHHTNGTTHPALKLKDSRSREIGKTRGIVKE